MSSASHGSMSDATGYSEPVMTADQYPEEIRDCLKLLDDVKTRVLSGEVESMSIYLDHRDECYQLYQTRGVSRHIDAGRLLEAAMKRLGFATLSDLPGDED